jgi:threonine/homoserine/homoserine lactone efflux protein
MFEPLQFLLSGILFGLIAGMSPGPLLTLVISETLRHNRKAGILIASAPLLTDLPIIAVSILIISKLSNSNLVLGILSIMGACFIAYLAYESISIKGVDIILPVYEMNPLGKGVIANFLNPHPYIFWIGIGVPIILKGYQINILCALLFVIGFYFFLIGSKIIIAFMVDKSRAFLKSRMYINIIRFLGVLLLIFAFIFLKEGMKFIGLIS